MLEDSDVDERTRATRYQRVELRRVLSHSVRVLVLLSTRDWFG
jgi:hypothetical protein